MSLTVDDLENETKLPALPDFDANDPVSVQSFLEAVKEALEVRHGLRGSELDKGVTFRDLFDAGIGSLVIDGETFTGPGDAGGALAANPAPGQGAVGVPTKPTNVTATGALANVILEWDTPTYSGHAFTEIWRAASNDLGAAIRIATVQDPVSAFADNLGTTGVTRYYWIRHVNKNKEAGPYHAGAASGASATTGLVGGVDITNLAITAAKLASGSVDTTKLVNDAVTAVKIATAAVENAKIAADAIDAAKIQADAVDGTHIIAAAIDSAHIAAAAIDTVHIALAAIDNAAIANAAVSTAKIQTAAITTALINDLAVTSAKIADASITSAKIGSAAVGTAAIQNAAITNALIANLAVDSAKIANATITGGKIAAETITGGNIAGTTITGDKIAATTITADKYNELRNTIYVTADDSLDASFPMEILFPIVSEMTSIVAIELSFSIQAFRTYSKVASSSAGADQVTSTSFSDPSHDHKFFIKSVNEGALVKFENGQLQANNGTGTAQVQIGAGGDGHTHTLPVSREASTGTQVFATEDGSLWTSGGGTIETTTNSGHKHTITLLNGTNGQRVRLILSADELRTEAGENVTVNTNVHTAGHSHNVTPQAHTHDNVLGIFEEANAPSITVKTSNNGGGTYATLAGGPFTTDQLELDLTAEYSGTGWKGIKFETDQRCRITMMLTMKLDISA